jgi:hypothetical protein
MTQDDRSADADGPAPDAGGTGPDQSDRVRESVGHLQVAAQEVIAAIRVMLDAAEEVVSDPSAATSLITTLADIARSARVTDGRSAAGGRHDGDDDGDDGGVQRIPVT